MSDIPLRIIGRNRNTRAGYTAVDNLEESETVERAPNMHAAVRAAASSSAANKGRRNRQNDRYTDDPEEEETLLGRHDEDTDLDDEAGAAERVSAMRSEVSVACQMDRADCSWKG